MAVGVTTFVSAWRARCCKDLSAYCAPSPSMDRQGQLARCYAHPDSDRAQSRFRLRGISCCTIFRSRHLSPGGLACLLLDSVVARSPAFVAVPPTANSTPIGINDKCRWGGSIGDVFGAKPTSDLCKLAPWRSLRMSKYRRSARYTRRPFWATLGGSLSSWGRCENLLQKPSTRSTNTCDTRCAGVCARKCRLPRSAAFASFAKFVVWTSQEDPAQAY